MAAVTQLPQTPFSAKRQKQPPVGQPIDASRSREYLTPDEVERMITAAHRTDGRIAERDALLIMMAYRHGLQASELIALRWDQLDLKAGTLHIARLKHGSSSTHPLRGLELWALCACRREQGDAAAYVFTLLRGGSMTWCTVHHVVSEAANATEIEFPMHQDMLGHAAGFYLANAGQDMRAIQMYLAHKNTQHTVKYMKLSCGQFRYF